MSKTKSILGYGMKLAKREMQFQLRKLSYATLELTYRCNLKCEMCALWKISPDEVDELSTEDWLRVVDELADLGVEGIGINGGEPTIVPGFIDIMKRVKARKMQLKLFTNGLSLNKYYADFAPLVDILSVSVDAPDERHDQIRGIPGALNITLEGVSKLVKYKVDNRQSTPEIHLHSTLLRSNVDAIADIIKLGDDAGVDVVSFQYLCCISPETIAKSTVNDTGVASDRFTSEHQDTLLFDDDAIRVFREQTRNLPKTKNALVIIEPTKSLSDHALKTGLLPVRRCTPMYNRLAIRPNGDTAVCAMVTGYPLGNVREKSIRDIWYGQARRELVDHLRKKLLPVCYNCCAFSGTLTVDQLAKIALGKQL